MRRARRLNRPGLPGSSEAAVLLSNDFQEDATLNLDFRSGVLDPRIDFQRTTTGTYYRGPFNQNLFRHSQDYTQGFWGGFASGTGSLPVITANAAVAPDGTMTANRVVMDRGNGTTTSDRSLVLSIQGLSIVVNAPYTLSVWMRGTVGGEVVTIRNAAIADVTVTLTTAWQRFSSTANALNSNPSMWVCGNVATTSPLQVMTIEVWGAQLTEGSLLTPYIPTTTAAITQGQIAAADINVPRFENDPITGAARGLLIEGGTTNVVTGSTGGTAITVTTAAITSPTGVVDGIRALKSDTTTPRYFRWATTVTPTVNTTYTASMFVKRGNVDMTTSLEFNNVGDWGGTGWIANFSVTATGVTVSSTTAATATVQDVGNGWYRVTATFTTGATTPTANGLILCKVSGTTNDFIYFWGGQLEAQSFASSYIPTTTATVARGADSALMTGTNFSSWYNQSAGTVLSEHNASQSNGTRFVGAFNAAGSATTYIDILRYQADARAIIYISGVTQSSLVTAIPSSTARKSAHAYEVGFSALSVMGTTVLTGSPASLPTVDTLQIGAVNATSFFLNGTISRLAYWPTRLPNATLQALTT